MPSKLEVYMERAEAAILRLPEDWRTWTSFLETASRVYKYRFQEQAMIYAQRPDAVACAGYDLWRKRMRRYVRRGSTGIGLISYKGGEPFVRFVFDISDTNENEGALYPDLWQYRSEYEPAVTGALESRYQVSGGDGLVKQLARIAVRLSEEHWDNYQDDILSAAGDSFLEGLDVSLAFRRSAAASIAYAAMSRCGLGPGDYFEPEDFEDLPNFNTVPAITQLGQAVSEASGQVLRQIEAAVKSPQRPPEPHRRQPEGNPAPMRPEPGKRRETRAQADQEAAAEGADASPAASASLAAPRETGAPAEAPQRASKAVSEPVENFRITDDDLGVCGPKVRFRANIEAITTLHAIEREGRNATREEQEVLSRYTGWGSLPDAFDPDKAEWRKEYLELNTVLTPDEYASARASVLNAYYTSPTVIRAMYQAVGNMGFKAGNILEPS